MDSLLDKDDLLKRYVLISDDQSSSDYFLHYFLCNRIRNDQIVCLISVTQDLLHYQAITSKLGTNLKFAQDRNQFHFIKTHSRTASTGTGPCCHNVTIDNSLKPLYQLINDVLSSFDQSKPVCVIIDDLSILLSLGVSLVEMLTFVKHCRDHLLNDDKKEGSLIIRIHRDSDVDDDEEGFLLRHILHYCHLHLHTKGLTTGYSPHISGEVSYYHTLHYH
jgi:hypothetical protein